MAKKRKKSVRYTEPREQLNPLDGIVLEEGIGVAANAAKTANNSESENIRVHSRPSRQNSDSSASAPQVSRLSPQPFFRSDSHGIFLYHANCLAVLDAISLKYPDGCFDMIFADPPYFLSNGGITCHAGKMVSVHKGDWDKSCGAEENHNFNRAWLERCQRVLKPNGTLWVTGTHHVIFSVGFAMQQLGMKILNDIAWEKPNPPPNLSCRYFTHSTETILWAAKNKKSKHRFNYPDMKKVTGKQMKTVWRRGEFEPQMHTDGTQMQQQEVATKDTKDTKDFSTEGNQGNKASLPSLSSVHNSASENISVNSRPLAVNSDSIWTVPPPASSEKQFGKHPTQKPVALIERCLLAASAEGDLVLDPFMGNGTTAVAAAKLRRRCVGIELELAYLQIAARRVDAAIHEPKDLFKK